MLNHAIELMLFLELFLELLFFFSKLFPVRQVAQAFAEEEEPRPAGRLVRPETRKRFREE